MSATGLLKTIKSSATGVFSVELKVPEGVYGGHFLIVKDEKTGESGSYSFRINSLLQKATGRVSPGDKILINAYGLSSSSKVHIWIVNAKAGVNQVLVDISKDPPIRTNQLGSLRCNITIPVSLGGGDYSLYVRDESARSVTQILTVYTKLTIEPVSVATGATIQIAGVGFKPSFELPAGALTMNGTVLKTKFPVETTSVGTFLAEVTVPTLRIGSYVVAATDGVNSATAALSVSKTTQLMVVTSQVAPGDSVTLTGRYFTVGRAVVDIVVAGVRLETEVFTDSEGGFNATFIVPEIDTHRFIVRATDENGLTASVTMRVTVSVDIQPVSGVPGTLVTLSSSGFNTTSGGLYQVSFNGVTLIGPTALNGSKGFEATFFVPSLPRGTYLVMVTDLMRGTSGQALFRITAASALVVVTDNACPGKDVVIRGAGFAPEVTAQLSLSNSSWVSQVETTRFGNFTATIVIPRGILPGLYTLRASTVAGVGVVTTQFAEAEMRVVEDIINATSPRVVVDAAEAVTVLLSAYQPKAGYTVTLIDPSGGAVYVRSLGLGDWREQGSVYGLEVSFGLPRDAAAGMWFWEVRDSGKALVGVVEVRVEVADVGVVVDYSQIGFYGVVIVGVAVGLGVVLSVLQKRGVFSLSVEVGG